MKLQSKIILIIIPFVFLSIIGLGYFAYSTSKNFAQDSFEKYMEGILSIYISQNVQPQYDLLVQNNLMDIPSFVNNYQSESAKLIDKLTLPWPGHFIIVTGEGKFVHTSVELKKNEIEEIWGKLAINLHKGNTEIDSGYVTDIDGAEFYKAMHFDPWNWYIFVSVHSGALTKSSNAIKKDATIISILTAIFLSLMIIFTTKKLIVTPIHKLSNAANEIGKTRKKVTIEINGNDEMSALSSQLESVSNEIEISDNKLKEWSNELEHQVKERTSELNEKNSMLNSEIEQKEIIQYDLMTAMKRYEDMVSGTDNLVTVVNPNGEYQYVNPAAENILGRNPKEMIGKLAFEDIHPDDQEYTLNHFQAWLKDKLVNTTIENRLLHQDGTSRIMQWNIFFNYDENKELVNINSIARDVTSAREAEEKLVEYSTQLEQTNNDVKSFAYIVSHDLRAPLVNMQGFVSELGYDLETLNEIINKNIDDIDDEDKPTMKDLLLEDIPESMTFIKSAVKKMDNLITSVLNISRIGRKELFFEYVNSAEIVQSVITTFNHQIEENNIEIELSPLPIIMADVVSLEQIFSNLINNSIKFMGGQKERKIIIKSEPHKDGHLFTVEDTGVGMSEAFTKKIFDLFSRAGTVNVDGEGMGMAYVQKIVGRHNGKIWCESELGKGTTFFIYLPTN